MTQSPRARASASIPIDGEVLRELRKDRGLTAVQLATRVGVGKSFISRLECGSALRCSPPVHAALVQVLQPADPYALRTDKPVSA